MKRFGFGTSFLLLLGVALSCAASDSVSEPVSGPQTPGGSEGSGTLSFAVHFDKNNDDLGSTEANPQTKTVTTPATTLDALPTPPTRPGFHFAEWNTARDGKGAPFTAAHTVAAHLTVYAQWVPLPSQLSMEAPAEITFSPMATETYSERSTTLRIRVSGFESPADASNLRLGIRTEDELPWLSWRFESSHVSEGEGSKTFVLSFVLHVEYLGEAFDEAPVETPVRVRLHLRNVPEGYEEGGAKTLFISTANGQDKTRPIPVHAGNIEAFNHYANTQEGLALHYRLVQDIRLEAPEPGQSNWTAIGTPEAPFTGSFDGKGFTLSGLTLHATTNHQGLFGVVHTGAKIANLGLLELNITGGQNVGGVAGSNSGTVQNCYATGSVEGSGNHIGGLVGSNSGTVQNCYATGSVEGSGNHIGGLVGSNGGTVQNCYATGSVEGSNNSNNVGGLVGHNDGGTVRNCYATGSVEGSGNVGGVVGSNSGTVQNCVALNSSIQASGNRANFGRVVGSGAATLENNFAFDGIKDHEGNTSWPNEDAKGINGEDKTAAQLQIASGFPEGLTLAPWTYQEGRLPGLFDQTVTMPEHIR